jgi:hypothetical protein
MSGQWYGFYEGSNTGEMVVELDDVGDHFYGYAYLYENDHTKPATWAEIRERAAPCEKEKRESLCEEES